MLEVGLFKPVKVFKPRGLGVASDKCFYDQIQTESGIVG